MRRWSVTVAGFLLGLTVVFAHAVPSSAQIKWNVTYKDAAGVGFNDNTKLSGETQTLGELRRNSVTASFNYLNTVLDGRGTVELQFDASSNDSGDGTLASFGPTGFATVTGVTGTFQNGQAYQAARANVRAFSAPDGQGSFNFGHAFNYSGQNASPSASAYDMVSVTIHELTHGHGFLNLVDQTGSGLEGNTPGTTGLYSVYDRYLQRGNGAGATALFNTNITNSNYASFANTSLTDTFTNGNNASTGLFFGGKYAQEVFGGPVPLYAPGTFAPGSSIGHDNTSTPGVMNFDIPTNTVRRFQPYEIGMLLDLGWNTYNWNGTTGNWLDGQSDVGSSRWRTDLGIVFQGGVRYNSFNFQDQAPILPPYAQVTSNIVLNFGGSGSTSYTATNDIGTVRLSRLNLNSTSTGTNTITGGTLLFGKNSDNTDGVLVAKIVQQNSGPFVIASNLQIPNGLVVDGPGSGQVTLSGPISGANGFVKDGDFTLVVTGNNTYTDGTFVFAGTMYVNGQTGSNSGTGTGDVSLLGGTIGGNGRIAGAISSTLGGVAPGDINSTGILTVGSGVTLSSLTLMELRLNGTTAGTNYDQLLVESGNVNLASSGLQLTFGYTPNLADRLVIVNNTGTGTTSGQFAGFAPGSPVNVGGTTVYAYYNYDVATGLFGSGNDVVIVFAPIPEPVTVLGISVFGLGAVRVVRRWRRATHRPRMPVSST